MSMVPLGPFSGASQLQWFQSLHESPANREPSLIVGRPGNRPGNRLVQSLSGSFELEPLAPAFVVGKLLARTFGSLAGRVSKALPSFSSVQTSIKGVFGSPTCYSDFLEQFPDMDRNSQSIVQSLCDDTVAELQVQNVRLNTDGVQAICAALKQNTVLTTLEFAGVSCDTESFATALVDALKENRSLRNLSLGLSDLQSSNILPTPIQPGALQTLFDALPCFELDSLRIGFGEITPQVADVLADVLKTNPYFPLKEFFLSWHNTQFSYSQFRSIVEGLNASQCIDQVGLGTYSGFTKEMLLSVFNMIGSGHPMANLYPWCSERYSLTDEEKQFILNATEANPCFLSFSDPLNHCFSPEFNAAIANMTEGRIPCESDSRCSIPLNCSDPEVGEPSASKTALQQQGVQAAIGAGGAALAAIAFAILFTIMRRRQRAQADQIKTDTVTMKEGDDEGEESVHLEGVLSPRKQGETP